MSHPLLEQLGERVLTVTEYLDLINELISPIRVSVEGEITDLKILREWVFFSLKDAESGALLRCGLHAGAYRRMGVNVEEGMAVKVLGYGKLSPKTGNFGFWVSAIEPIGEGALRRAYELLLKKLSEEGLFARKRELPAFIRHIGVVSSRDGVVLQDLRRNLHARGIRIDFVHSGVEGAASAPDLVRAIEHFSAQRERPDVLVLIRGGGSLESLQGFNNEAVCRALFAAPMPVLVGIGHDVDAPIATLVADVSVSTPTAVATAINASWSPLVEGLPRISRELVSRYARGMQRAQHHTMLAARTMRHAVSRVFLRFHRYEENVRAQRTKVAHRLSKIRQDTTDSAQTASRALTARLAAITRLVGEYERALRSNDPTRVLKRGFSLVYAGGALVRSVEEVSVGAILTTELMDGRLVSTVTERRKE